ncbi:hypothetical protein I350_03209 [Cryptococcus amylolentus CBS 6273]|uniref:F-box domain-containing protein n=1 Tax=Cryptococcus amylolentus CBS 6273 TaxID=1296118 RepID=A0A1E3K973_9TREE|nr:hypothetical protein I350_03209 [Cryptococcus amylolentus CBS 6273]
MSVPLSAYLPSPAPSALAPFVGVPAAVPRLAPVRQQALELSSLHTILPPQPRKLVLRLPLLPIISILLRHCLFHPPTLPYPIPSPSPSPSPSPTSSAWAEPPPTHTQSPSSPPSPPSPSTPPSIPAPVRPSHDTDLLLYPFTRFRPSFSAIHFLNLLVPELRLDEALLVNDPKTLARCPQVSHYWNALLQDAATWRYHFSLHHLPDGPASLAALLMEHHRGIVQSVGTEKEPRHAARHAVKLVLLVGIPSSFVAQESEQE